MKFPKLVENKATGFYLSEEAARELDNIVANLPKDSAYHTPKKKDFMSAPEIDPGETERAEVSVISTNDIDRHSDLIVQDGIDFSLFDKGRVVLYEHDPERPVGKCLWYKNLGAKTVAKTQYPNKPDGYEGDWLPDKIWALTTAGILPGKSVTIWPVQLSEPSAELRSKGCEVVWDRCIVVEYSVVSIPANADCLVQAIEKGLDLNLLGIKRTGERVKTRTKRIEYIDRTADLCRAVAGLKIDTNAIVDRVLQSLKDRGKAAGE